MVNVAWKNFSGWSIRSSLRLGAQPLDRFLRCGNFGHENNDSGLRLFDPCKSASSVVGFGPGLRRFLALIYSNWFA